jgi:hypothetical protein
VRKIAKSSVWPTFEVEVAAFAHEMRNWRAHMKCVADDEHSGVTGIDKHWPLQRPSTHPTVETAVNENDAADYEILDDGPTPAQVLAAKKSELMGRVSAAEQAAIAAVVPPGKRRLFNLRENDIRNADAERAAKITEQQRGILASISSAIGVGNAVDMAADVEQQRPADDTRHLEEQAERRRRIAEIERVAAQAHHDIEDLTIDTVDSFQIPVFHS